MDLVKIIKEDIINKKNKYAARKYFDYNPNNRENGDIDIVGNDNKIHTIYNKNKGEFYTNYFELIVNQKIDYLLAKEPTINKNDLFSITDLTDMLEDLLLNASLDTVSWLHFYVEDNILKSFIVDDREIIPFYDKYKKKIYADRYVDISEMFDQNFNFINYHEEVWLFLNNRIAPAMDALIEEEITKYNSSNITSALCRLSEVKTYDQ